MLSTLPAQMPVLIIGSGRDIDISVAALTEDVVHVTFPEGQIRGLPINSFKSVTYFSEDVGIKGLGCWLMEKSASFIAVDTLLYSLFSMTVLEAEESAVSN
jgi:hypothetical protein